MMLTDARHRTGREGETIAAAFLVARGARLLHRNWRACAKGVRGEIDLIVQIGDTLCFVEVKTRASSNYGEPQEAVTASKQRQICRLASAYATQFSQHEITIRFDIVEVWLAPDNSAGNFTGERRKPRVAWIENAFAFQAPIAPPVLKAPRNPMIAAEPPFFVYGTLRAGQPNAHLLRGAIARARPAMLRGAQMWDLGPYPMITEAGEGQISGELLEIEPLRYAATLQSLDRLEGVNGARPDDPRALYRRLKRWVIVEEQPIEAWVYFGREALARRGKWVQGGDWLSRFNGGARSQQIESPRR